MQGCTDGSMHVVVVVYYGTHTHNATLLNVMLHCQLLHGEGEREGAVNHCESVICCNLSDVLRYNWN